MVQFQWHYEGDHPVRIKDYLKHLGIPRKFVSHVKFEGGNILLNGQEVNVLANLEAGDVLNLVAADEGTHETVPPSHVPIQVIYEDRDLLIVNKPTDVVSIPSKRIPDSAMANRVKGYYQRQGYADQVIHIVTRLDRQTTGLMLIAKHRLAHAMLDKQVQGGQVEKYYLAISTKADWPDHGVIDRPIAHTEDSIITRRVHESGQRAVTEYWLKQAFADSSLLKLRLHTGRTHQIRVHMQDAGGVLVGDDLYGGPHLEEISRQALHCGELRFTQPFTGQRLVLSAPLPEDMAAWLAKRESNLEQKESSIAD